MVGIGEGQDRMDVLARVSIVTRDQVLLNTFVKVEQDVTEFRTEVSGVTREDLESPLAEDFGSVVEKVKDLLERAEVIVGHGLEHDEEVLKMKFPPRKVRDTSRYRPFLKGGRTPSLKWLTLKYQNKQIQEGEHDSIEDARAALHLYLQVDTTYLISVGRQLF